MERACFARVGTGIIRAEVWGGSYMPETQMIAIIKLVLKDAVL